MPGHIEQARELMRRSRSEHFAVGAFNVDNQETLIAIARAARSRRSPVLVEISHGEAEVIGLANLRSLVDNYRDELGVEIYVNLDHSPSIEAAKAGIDHGFEFIHIDLSQAQPNASVGNLHGRYPVPKQLDLELLERIRQAIAVNISLHGGSGTPGHYFQNAAQIGVSKINVNSDLRYAYRTTLEQQLREHPDEYAIVKVIGPVIDAVQTVVEERIDVFGSAGKARR